ncbi:tryptophan synthase beta subunit-like PLP-dependent enzyme [Aspergillus sclerotioniger CBS 115572]|uniref:Tryptophan synthase beta subunit-like PLP-dependent enzyme n=1 Tax=Aspergillus sclerotioniger CBS 115572 TaxID=1450535 RepID=A0A317WQH9_9EURO|nr:tryptophan synthase beta subunit-like PLP-dependent enzyme [Aspergillus sclerotioniger CBS 115572]PWY86430.1 tryptophan synthase beta subunit-like PLP-dependent enzyme [Aspergillus sclerotioniger CBS 115572]
MIPLPSPFSQIPRPNHPPHPPQPQPQASPHQSPLITIYTKREDQSSPFASSGNKYRKLEYLIPDILSSVPKYGTLAPGPHHGTLTHPPNPPPAKKTTTLVTEGALQSNHTIQVTSIANHFHLESVIILHKATGGGLNASTNKEAFTETGNVQIARLLGADIRVLDSSTVSSKYTSTDPTTATENDTEDGVASILSTLQTHHQKSTYWIPSGASLHPLGGLGYARCAFEIAFQEKTHAHTHLNPSPKLRSRFDYIFVACGSGSTLGGLIAGMKLLQKEEEHQHQNNPPRKIIGIMTSPTQNRAYHEDRVLGFARQAAGLIGLDGERDIGMEDVCVDERFAGMAYGELDGETREVLGEMAREEAVLLDPVYTGKVVRGMRQWVREGEIARDWVARGGGIGEEVNVLFIHTGGQTALSAYADVV